MLHPSRSAFQVRIRTFRPWRRSGGSHPGQSRRPSTSSSMPSAKPAGAVATLLRDQRIARARRAGLVGSRSGQGAGRPARRPPRSTSHLLRCQRLQPRRLQHVSGESGLPRAHRRRSPRVVTVSCVHALTARGRRGAHRGLMGEGSRGASRPDRGARALDRRPA